MKKLFAILICVIMCGTLFASCDKVSRDEECVHTKGNWIGDVHGHWQPEYCSLDKKHIYGPSVKEYHIDEDKNDICDVCGYEYMFIFKLMADYAGYELDRVGPGYKGGDIVIPSAHNGLPVTQIGYSAFTSDYKLTSVVIPKTVTLIDGDAFENQTSLTSVIVGEGVVTIGVSAFEGCTSLKTLIISNATEYIYASAFEDCTALESVTLGKNVKEITGSVFENCTSLKTIEIPASIEKMGSWVFNGNNMNNIYFGVSAPGKNWSEKWAEGLNENVNIHWAEVENKSDIVPLSNILQKLPYGYNEQGLIEKYNFYEERDYYLVDNSKDYCEFLSDIGVPYEGPFDTLFDEKVIFCYLRCVSGSADFIPVKYFYDGNTNKIECETIYQPEPDIGFPAVEICWCVDLVEVPKSIFEQLGKNTKVQTKIGEEAHLPQFMSLEVDKHVSLSDNNAIIVNVYLGYIVLNKDGAAFSDIVVPEEDFENYTFILEINYNNETREVATHNLKYFEEYECDMYQGVVYYNKYNTIQLDTDKMMGNSYGFVNVELYMISNIDQRYWVSGQTLYYSVTESEIVFGLVSNPVAAEGDPGIITNGWGYQETAL